LGLVEPVRRVAANFANLGKGRTQFGKTGASAWCVRNLC